MKSTSPIHTVPPSNACNRLLPPTNRSPLMIMAKPIKRYPCKRSPKIKTASTLVHSGRLPGISTEPCAAGAKKKPL